MVVGELSPQLTGHMTLFSDVMCETADLTSSGGDYLIPSHHGPLKMKRVVSFHGSIPDRLVKGQYWRGAAGGDVE